MKTFREYLAEGKINEGAFSSLMTKLFNNYKITVAGTGIRTNAGDATYFINWLDVKTNAGEKIIYMGGATGSSVEFYDDFKKAVASKGIVTLHNKGYAYYKDLIKEYGEGGVNYNNVNNIVSSDKARNEVYKIVNSFIDKAIEQKSKTIEGSIFMDNNQQKMKSEFVKIISDLGLKIETETRSVIEYSGKILVTTELDNIKTKLKNGSYYIVK